MTKYKKANVKYNGGVGALLCNHCKIIIEYGFDHKDRIHLCEKCEKYRNTLRAKKKATTK